MAGLRLVLFDLDGTLIDSQTHIIAAMETAFKALSVPAPERAAILGIVGLSLPQAMLRLAPQADAAVRAELVEAYKQAFFDLRQAGDPRAASPLYPGARAALDVLHGQDSTLLGIATGKSRRGTQAVLAAHGLGPYFVTRQVADDHPSKPHPAMVLAALDDTGVLARDAVMIGDTEYDMQMAVAAGVAAIGVAWGYHSVEALRAAGARAVITHFDALAPALEALWETR